MPDDQAAHPSDISARGVRRQNRRRLVAADRCSSMNDHTGVSLIIHVDGGLGTQLANVQMVTVPLSLYHQSITCGLELNHNFKDYT